MIRVSRRDFGTLQTLRIAHAGLSELEAAREGERAETLARIIHDVFRDYYQRSRKIPWLAKEAFETRDWTRAIELSQERIAIYSVAIDKVAPILAHVVRESDASGLWGAVESAFGRLVASTYEQDLALAFLTSVRRQVLRDLWVPVGYGVLESSGATIEFLTRFAGNGAMTAELVGQFLAQSEINAPFKDLAGDGAGAAARINEELDISPDNPLEWVEVVRAGFFRNRGAYVVGALCVGGRVSPLALALMHRESGVEIDAVILRASTLSHVFSSTLANLHVTLLAYHQLVDYLYMLMPLRPRGLHYSTVGYHHVGKLAVMQQLRSGLGAGREVLDHAPGPRGSVAMGMTAPGLDYVAKVIRDKPTDQYKWGEFSGVASVLQKYRRVHELNRSGSMLDNIIYSRLTLPRALFAEALLEELLEQAGNTVSLYRGEVMFDHLIVQRKLTPLPLYLETCTPREAELVVIRLGQCIRNNAATNVFNKDFDGRNYGVSSLRFVYLFDYDAIETLTDVKVRTNAGREDGEEEPPDWFFEEGTIFLPEEMEQHLRLPSRALRRLFQEAHGALLSAEYWWRMQDWLKEGRVPRVRTYPRSVQLVRDRHEANLSLIGRNDDSEQPG